MDVSTLESGTTVQNVEESRNAELEELRKRLREEKLAYRKKQREFSLQKMRFVEGIQRVEYVTADELVTLANNLRHKNRVTCKILNSIRNALLDGQENIQAFLSVDGALQSLLRAFTGQDEKYQLLAAKCISNLAKGNEKSSLQVLKASDSYLFAHLAGRNRYIIEACADAIANFSMHGGKHIELLQSQGFFPTIKKLLLTNADEMLESSFTHVLACLVYHGFDVLRDEDVKDALLSIIPTFERKSFLVAFLMSVISARKSIHEEMGARKIHIQALKRLFISLTEKEKESVFYIRIISNCISDESSKMAVDLTEEENHRQTLRECANFSLRSEEKYTRKEFMGLIGNLINHSNESISRFGMELLKDNFEIVEDEVMNRGRETEMAVDS